MSFDNSRYTFNPFDSYSSVVMPQGRVQLDADWNEFLAEIARRIQAGTLDTMGRAVYPPTTPDAFYISPSGTPWVVDIGQGRMYVDGLLAENHGPTPGTWDPALAELSGSPQPAPTSITGTPSIPFTSQPQFPGATPPSAAGSYLFYLDVWTRAVTWLQDPSIIDPAVGIDTSGRLQTVWQVRWMPAASANLTSPGTPVTCATPDAQIAFPASSAGLLSNGLVPNTATGPCCLTAGTGYTGLENQFYRVEIHKGGPVGTATFKWSRENASVITGVNTISTGANPSGTSVTVLTVFSLGRDQVLNFSNGDWIEILDDDIEYNGKPDATNPYGNPGILCQIDTVDPTTNTIYLTAQLSGTPTPSPSLHTRIVRWDQSGTVGEIPVPSANTSVTLENSLTVSFSLATPNGNFLSGDFWTFSARTDGSYDQIPNPTPPRGIHHHYTKLSVVTFDGGGSVTNTPDCRTPWGCCSGEGNCGCCTVTVGDNQTSFGTYTSIQQAIDNLPSTGGEVCILPGKYYEYVTLSGVQEVTLRGCGPETILYAFSAAPAGYANRGASSTPVVTDSGVSAIITIANSQHIELTNFTIEAPDSMSCIVLDQISNNARFNIEVAKKNNIAQRAEQLARQVPIGTSRPGSNPQQNPVQTNIPIGTVEKPIYYVPQYPKEYGNGASFYFPQIITSDTDVTLTNLVLTASAYPAIVAVEATLLNICDNHILMADVASFWPAVYVSGAQITIERNWIGLQDLADAANYATEAVLADLANNFTLSTSAPVANGGIQIGGYTTGVSIVDNQIEGGAFNAISLGAILLFNGTEQIPGLNGLFFTSPLTSTGTSLVLPPTVGNYLLAADGPLQDIRIERNCITNIGLCGIGPVGFFNSSTPEVVSVANLRILGNTISGTLQAPITPFPQSINGAAITGLGYGAICLPDLQNVILRDNTITDFGYQPGAQVCGLFILNGEQIEISRNQILETRDWTTIDAAATSTLGLQAGIAIPMVSPPALNQTATAAAWTGASSQGVPTPAAPGNPASPPIYQPGLPALRVDQNVVRVPLGCALEVLGYGPFSITGNQLTSGGTVPANTFAPALTVAIVNAGAAIEIDTPTSFTGLWGTASNPTPPTLQVVDNSLSNSTSGMVLFSNNFCQLETRANGATGLSSVAILTKDHLNFSNNLTWIDGVDTINAFMSAFLLGGTVQVASNRIQESPYSVLFSGLIFGLVNITTGNISTHCLFSELKTMPYGVFVNNISILGALTNPFIRTKNCNDMAKTLLRACSRSSY